MGENFRYKAFISYSHTDEAIAAQLHERLERYHLPNSLGLGYKSLKPIFRDRDELTSGSSLGDAIKSALTNSENLIVLCSPQSARSKWVEKEILFFKAQGRADNIFTAIIDGEPFAASKGRPDLECIPRALRFETGADGKVSDIPAEPLAADLREMGDGERIGTLKLISALAGVGLDAIVRRDLQRKRKQALSAITVASVIMATMGILTVRANIAENKAEIAKQAAESNRAQAEDLIEFMLGDLRTRLEPVGRLEVLDVVGEKALEYYALSNPSDMDFEAKGRRARTLHLIGEVEDKLGHSDKAARTFEESYDMTLQNKTAAPDSTRRLFEHARSAYWQSVPHRRAGDHAAEMPFLKEYEALAIELVARDNNNPIFAAELAMAKTNCGRVQMAVGDDVDARTRLKVAAGLFDTLTQDDSSSWLKQRQAENFAWLAESYRRSKEYQQAYELRTQQVQILEKQYAAYPQDYRNFEELIYAQLGLGSAARYLKNYDESYSVLHDALDNAKLAIQRDPGREKMLRGQMAVMLSLMTTALETNQKEAYQKYRRDAAEFARFVTSRDVKMNNKFWTNNLPEVLKKMDKTYQSL